MTALEQCLELAAKGDDTARLAVYSALATHDRISQRANVIDHHYGYWNTLASRTGKGGPARPD